MMFITLQMLQATSLSATLSQIGNITLQRELSPADVAYEQLSRYPNLPFYDAARWTPPTALGTISTREEDIPIYKHRQTASGHEQTRWALMHELLRSRWPIYMVK